MTMMFKLAAPFLVAIAASAAAAPVAVTSYDTPNGSGQASGGSFNYWDIAYTGAGSTTTDGAALTGCVGDLTDGIVAPDFWFNTENSAGTGPYVGWLFSTTPNPLVKFNFAGSPTITSISVHMDNSNAGGVFAPSSILIDGVATAFVEPADGTIGTVTFTGLNLTGSSHTLQFNHAGSGTWVFISEVSFAGGAVVPEPATWGLMIAGFAMVGAAARRRRSVVAA